MIYAKYHSDSTPSCESDEVADRTEDLSFSQHVNELEEQYQCQQDANDNQPLVFDDQHQKLPKLFEDCLCSQPQVSPTDDIHNDRGTSMILLPEVTRNE